MVQYRALAVVAWDNEGLIECVSSDSSYIEVAAVLCDEYDPSLRLDVRLVVLDSVFCLCGQLYIVGEDGVWSYFCGVVK